MNRSLKFSKNMYFLLIIFYFLLSPFQFITIAGIGIVRIVNIVVLSFLLLKFIKNLKTINLSKVCFLLLLLIYIPLTCIWSLNLSRALNTFIMYVLILLNYAVISSFKWNINQTRLYFLITNVVSIIISILLIFEISIFNMAGRITLKINGAYADPNFLGINIVFSILCNIYLLITKKRNFVDLFLLLSLIIQISAIVKLASRGTIISLVITSSVFLFPYIKSKPKMLLGILLMLLAIFPVISDVIYTLPQNVVERLDLQQAFQDGANGRFEIWSEAINMLMQNPINFIFGFGAGQMPIYLEYAHNFFIELFFDFGLIGLTLMLLFLFQIFLFNLDRNPFKISIFLLVIIASLSLSTDRCVLMWNILILINIISDES